MPETLPRRQDVPDENKWSIESVFPNVEAWEAEYGRVEGCSAALPPIRDA